MKKTHEIYQSQYGTYHLRFSLLGHRVHESTKTKEYLKALALLKERQTQIVLADMHKSNFPVKEIYQHRNKTYWLRFVHHGDIIHESTKTKDFARAIEILEAKQSAPDKRLESKGYTAPPDITISNAITKAKSTYIKELRGGQTVILRLNKILDMLGDIPLKTINKAHFLRIREELMLNELSASAINSYSANLNTLLKTARDEWGVNCQNVSRIKLRIKKPSIRIISPHEDAFIRQWMNSEKAVRGSRSKWNNSDLREIYSILIYTGMRIGELFAFSVNQMEGHKLKLLPEQHKTGDIVGNKVIVLNTEAQFILSMRISRLNLKGSDIVFPFNRKQYSRIWRRMRKEMDIPVTERFTPHCTRHTFASNLIKAGATIYEVSKLLGHESVTTTEMYAHLFTDDLAKVAELLVKPKRR